MKPERIRVAWLAPYPVTRLEPELAILRTPRLEHPASWLVSLVDALAGRDDLELHVITASAAVAQNQTVTKEGIAFHVVRHAFPFTVRGFPRYLRLDLWSRYAVLRWQIGRLLQTLRPDLIHVHGTEYGYALPALDSGLPTIVSMQGIVTLLAGSAPTVSSRLQASIERNVVRRAKYFGSRTAWATDFIGRLNQAATVYDLPEAVGEVFFRTTGASTLHDHILMVGTVAKPKGIEEALLAMAIVVTAYPPARLVIVGSGPADYLVEVKRRTQSIGVSGSVDWLGFRTAPEIAALHASSALLIHPSHLDNSPNSVAEAMASGLPVIASNVGGIPSMIEHNVSGLLVPPQDPHALAGAIVALLRSPSERLRLAASAKAVAFERHFPAKVAAQTLRVYHDVLTKEIPFAAVARGGHR